jgi:hypothetical protein
MMQFDVDSILYIYDAIWGGVSRFFIFKKMNG